MSVELYDATLRDGMQGEGMSLTAEEKLKVAHALDRLGIDIIEAGFPASNPKELELFGLLALETFQHAQIAAFGMTRRKGIAAEDDDNLQVLAACFAPVCTLVGKTWSLHLEKVTKVSREENLDMIEGSIAFLVAQGKRVIYDAEHFFDAWRDDRDYAIECLRAAARGGAERVVPCDTNGSSLPDQITAAMTDVVASLDVPVGIHCHDDLGCGVANTLAAVQVGASQVQGTTNGIGERTGNANLTTVIGALQVAMGRDVLEPEQLANLTSTAHFVDELLNRNPNPQQPFVGRNAFAHKGGLHVAGVREDASTFEHMEPELVGNERKLVVSELAGRHTVAERAAAIGLDVDAATAQRLIDTVKQLEHLGYQFEAADGSFELLVRKELGLHESLFRLESWRTVVDMNERGDVECMATIKIWVGDQRHVRHAEGNGPVNALDRALREAIVEFHPHLQAVQLVDYKVRLLDQHHGTGATTRVLVESSDGERTWGTIGVAENVIAASWQALVDSLEYAEQPAPVRD